MIKKNNNNKIIMVSTSVWGPFYWKLLHNITVLYPDNPSDKDKIMIMRLIMSYQYLLPCNKCESHYRENLILFPLTDQHLSSKFGMISWGIKMHNIVNAMLKKKSQITDSYDDIAKEIIKYKSLDTKKNLSRVFDYSTENKIEIHKNMQYAFSELYNSVNHFLIYYGKDLNKILVQKKTELCFETKKNIQKISFALKSAL